MSDKRVNLGFRIIGKNARQAQVALGATTKQRLGRRILGAELAPAAIATATDAERVIDEHIADDLSVKELRFLISEEHSDLSGIEERERQRTGGPRKMILAAIEAEHERRRAAHPADYAPVIEGEQVEEESEQDDAAAMEQATAATTKKSAGKKKAK